jgi:hypothetical protein
MSRLVGDPSLKEFFRKVRDVNSVAQTKEVVDEVNMLISKGREEINNFSAKEISDGHHTFGQLYNYRMLYNAMVCHMWAKSGDVEVYKSRLHENGKVPFGDPDYFVVVAILPSGQISNHYRMKDWDKFNVVAYQKALHAYDGHTPEDCEKRMEEYLKLKNQELTAAKRSEEFFNSLKLSPELIALTEVPEEIQKMVEEVSEYFTQNFGPGWEYGQICDRKTLPSKQR